MKAKERAADDDLVRLYVSRRAADQRATGWVKLAQRIDGDWAAWMSVSEAEARAAPLEDYAHRVRTLGQPWCEYLGPNTAVADDAELQAFFLTVDDDRWPRLSTAIHHDQRQAISDWREAGARLLAAAAGRSHASPASSLFLERGTGRRSLIHTDGTTRMTESRPHLPRSNPTK